MSEHEQPLHELVAQIQALYEKRAFGELLVQEPGRHTYSRDLYVPRAEGVQEFVAHSVRIPEAALIAALVNAWPRISREISALKADAERKGKALDLCVNLLSIWRAWTPDYCTAHKDFESLPEIQQARAALSTKE